VRLDRVTDATNLVHQVGVNGQTAGGVDDENVAADTSCLRETARCGGHRVARFRKHRDIDLATERAQLLDRGGTLQVGSHQQRLATLRLEPTGQLGGAGGLARSLETRHQDDGRWLAGIGDFQRVAAEDCRQFLVDDLDDLLARVEGLRKLCADCLLANARDDVARDGDVDVGVEQCGADFRKDFVDVGLGEAAATTDLVENRLEFRTQAVEHDAREATQR